MLQYKILKICFQLIAALPFSVLYKLSDGLFILLYRILRYRRKIVAENLAMAFPEKTLNERREIAKQFYLNLTDMLFETIKMLALTEPELKKRFVLVNPNVIKGNMQKKGAVLLLGHQFNWEWGNWVLNHELGCKIIAVYTPIKNPLFNQLLKELRTAKGSIVAKSIDKNLLQITEPTLTALVADQNPSNLSQAYWHPFMNRIAPYHAGFEKLIYKTEQIPIFARIQKIKRGHYQVTFESPFSSLPPYHKGIIIEPYIHFLENCLTNDPANYLWSHRRWKHSPK
jgi:KDO2-lipid IV(A) lauroyltransferase